MRPWIVLFAVCVSRGALAQDSDDTAEEWVDGEHASALAGEAGGRSCGLGGGGSALLVVSGIGLASRVRRTRG